MDSESFPKIAVIGASSMVGSRFCELFKIPQKLLKADLKGSNVVDITNIDSVDQFFKKNDFQVVILFSAYTDVDGAESQRDNKSGPCWRINVEGAKNVAANCLKKNCKLIFISTDFVFDGQNGPYEESSKRGGDIKKISWYGQTKLKAEEEIENILDDFIITRIAFPYRASFEPKIDFARQILKKYDEGNLYPMFTDQRFTPTFIDDLAPAFNLLITSGKKGIYHISSPQITTPYDFAKELLTVFNKDTSILKKGSLREFLENGEKTPRPMNSALSSLKIENLGFKPTEWKEGIKEIFAQTKN